MPTELSGFQFVRKPKLTLSNVRTVTGRAVHAPAVGYVFRRGYSMFGLCHSHQRLVPAATLTADQVDCSHCLKRLVAATIADRQVPVEVSRRKLVLWALYENHLIKPFLTVESPVSAAGDLWFWQRQLAQLIDTECDRAIDAEAISALVIEAGESLGRKLLGLSLAA